MVSRNLFPLKNYLLVGAAFNYKSRLRKLMMLNVIKSSNKGVYCRVLVYIFIAVRKIYILSFFCGKNIFKFLLRFIWSHTNVSCFLKRTLLFIDTWKLTIVSDDNVTLMIESKITLKWRTIFYLTYYLHFYNDR